MSATEVELDIGGMTCASCASRVERKLNRMPGVTASVNYATEKAAVHVPEGTTASDLIATVEATGYTAQLPVPANATTDEGHRQTSDDETSLLRRRVIVSAVLALPVVVLSMVPAWQFMNWQWLALTLAAPVTICWQPSSGRCMPCSSAPLECQACTWPLPSSPHLETVQATSISKLRRQ